MPTVQIYTKQRRVSITVALSCPLDEAILRAGISFPRPCAGAHTCGRCLVRVYGSVTPPDQSEKQLLDVRQLHSNLRLACCARVTGDCMVELPDIQRTSVRLTGSGTVFSGAASFRGNGGWSLAADIGTTTVAAYLIDLAAQPDAGQPLSYILRGSAGAPNAQAAFGADVISRIESANTQGIHPLQKAVLTQLDHLFDRLLRENNLPSNGVRGIVLTGNTTMLHIVAGLSPAGLGVFPFTAESLFGVKYASRTLFRCVPSAVEVYVNPCVGAYVGGDLVSAAVACSLVPGELLLDVGTNGEIALMTEKGLLCCATAAGPAFEGVNLRCGMTAATGAIYEVTVQDQTLAVKTVDHAIPVGICGAGAISALAALCRLGWMDETGRLVEEYQQEGAKLADNVFLTQTDIRQLQLAKGAIAAGIDTLLQHAGIEAATVTKLYLAGGFGAAIDPKSAAEIGLFPSVLQSRVHSVGNAAGMGACACARWQAAMDAAEQLVKGAKELSLSDDGYFNERFIENMSF